MRHIVFRLFFIAISFFLLFTYVFPWHNFWLNVPFSWKEYKLGLDLQWWIELDYKVDLTEARKNDDFDRNREAEIIEWLKSIIDRRIETLNINDSEINDASYGWERHIIVQIPLKWNDSLENSENIERAKNAIWRVVKIMFKERRSTITEEDILFRQEIANSALSEINEWERFSVISDKFALNYENTISWNVTSLENIVLNSENILEWEINDVELVSWDKWYLILEKIEDNINYLFISSSPSEWKDAADSKWRVLDDKYFVTSSVQFNEAFKPMVELVFNNEWSEIFWELSRRLVWQQMAIFVWGEMLTAPVINEPIYGWKAVITWDYTPEEARKLSQDINTWVVPAPIYLTSEKTIDSKIWEDSLNKLIYAWISWFILIFIFLIFVYRLSWLAASISLFIYVVIILSVIKSLWVVLTLASIAWLILSLWMAIDANILIFERIKDELKKWNNILNSTEVWFKKSWSAIWDSNVTWLIVSIILFIFWINMIKWFWLMLAIWIVVSLFTVMWVSRVFIIYMAVKIKNKNLFVGFNEKK